MNNINSWAKNHGLSKKDNLPWRRLVVPTIIPLMIAGGLLAAFAVPASNRRMVELSLFIEPADGIVVGKDGPHRFYPCVIPDAAKPASGSTAPTAPSAPVEPKTKADESSPASVASDTTVATAIPVKSENEFNDLSALHGRLQILRSRDYLTLFVSAVANVEHDRILLLTNATSTNSPEKFYLQDLIRVVSQSPCEQRLVVLDIQWPISPLPATEIAEPQDTFDAVAKVITEQADQASRYLLTSGRDAWASGMESPRDSAFTHFWRLAIVTPATDVNHDGRVDVNEVFAATRKLLGEWSADNLAHRQTPISLGANVNFDLAIASAKLPKLAGIISPEPISYPDWLCQAWKQRDDYLSRFDIPADSTFLDVWQDKLLAVESRWRRGIDDIATQAETENINQWATLQISQQFAESATLRPDSLWLAAKALPWTATIDQQIADSISKLISSVDAIETTADDPATIKAIDKVIEQVLIGFPPEQQLRLLDGLVEYVCGSPTDSLLQRLTVVAFAKQLKVDNTFAETLIFQQTLVDGINVDSLDHDILRLTRARCQLGDRARIFAVMPQRLHTLLDDCLTAEQFYWFEGFTTDEIVRSQVQSALTRVEIGLSQQHCLEQAVSVLEQSLALLRCGRALTDFSDQVLDILGKSERLCVALYHVNPHAEPIKLGDAALRFEAIRYATEQLSAALGDLISTIVISSETHQMDSMLCVIPATLRPTIYRHLLSQYPIRRIDFGKKHATTADAEHVVDKASFARRLLRIEHKVAGVKQLGQRNMGVWLQHLAQTAAKTNDPTGFYQALANRLQFRDGIQHQEELATEWSKAPVDWSNRKAELTISVSIEDPQGRFSKLSLLETASPSLRVFPSGMELKGGESRSLSFSLGVHADREVIRLLNGVWLRWEHQGETKYVPVRFPSFPSCQTVELKMEGSLHESGSQKVWRLWPKSSPQLFDWSVVNHDSSPKSIVVQITNGAGLDLITPPMMLATGIPQPVRFAAPKKVDTDDSLPAVEDAASKLQVVISDAKSNAILTEYQIEIDLVDIRRCLKVNDSRFELLNNGGRNLLKLNLEATAAADPRGHQVDLALSQESVETLVSIGSGNSSVSLTPENGVQQIRLSDISVDEGPQDGWQIPLTIDGDSESLRLQALTPYVGGPTSWELLERPTILLDHPSAWIPGKPFTVKLRGMNLPISATLEVEYGQYADGRFVTHDRKLLDSPQRQWLQFSAAGADATLQVDARFLRWEVEIPTDSISGNYVIRVRSPENLFEPSEASILLDDQSPAVANVYASATDLTKVHIELLPGPSGVREVAMLATDKTYIQAIRDPSDPGDSDHWVVQAKKAMSSKEATVVTLQVTSGAGKTMTTDVPVTIVTPSTMGILRGIVLEGAIPQPQLTVDIVDSRGRGYRVQTDQQGQFKASLPAGNYRMSTVKKVSGRRATSTVTVKVGETSHLEMHLMRDPKQPSA